MLLATDLDGTLRVSAAGLADTETRVLKEMGTEGIIRVLLTGRNYYSLKNILPEKSPLDFVCYSSGAGILRWSDQTPLKISSMAPELSEQIDSILQEQQHSYFRLHPLPENHRFSAVKGNKPPEDFYRRKKKYAPWETAHHVHGCSQFLVILPNEEERNSLIQGLSNKVPQATLIRATSPMDHRTPWLEIFPENTNKSSALAWLCNRLKIPRKEVYALGNDWNDQDMLQWAGQSWVVPGSPGELKKLFPCTVKKGLSPLEYLWNQMLGELQ